MSLCLNNVDEAYGPLLGSHWEKNENPQHYNRLVTQQVHPLPQRHILGLVGGNEVTLIKGNMVDLESDLKGIHIPHTFCPSRQYQPLKADQKEIIRNNAKNEIKIDVQPAHLPVYQMMAYPAVMAPAPIVNEVCVRPEKY